MPQYSETEGVKKQFSLVQFGGLVAELALKCYEFRAEGFEKDSNKIPKIMKRTLINFVSTVQK